MNINLTTKEITQLIIAWIGISIAFSILLINTNIGIINVFLLSFLTAGLGFIVHELSHKYVANYYKCQAEFKANYQMILLGIGMSFLGFIFTLPGAVHIKGYHTRAQSAIIASAGPISNLILALLFIPFLFGQGLTLAIGYFGFFINSFLGLFNMIPFGPFDGAKIYIWNKKYWTIITTILLTLVIINLFIL